MKETLYCGNANLCIWGGVEKRHLCLCLRISEVYEIQKRVLTRDGWNISFTLILTSLLLDLTNVHFIFM